MRCEQISPKIDVLHYELCCHHEAHNPKTDFGEGNIQYFEPNTWQRMG